MHQTNIVLLIATAFLFGFRHGIDWDHIAAITNITGNEETPKTRITHGFMYILGHALVIVILGFLAIILGMMLPSWVDTVMEPIVGVTLIFLGIFLVYSVIKHGKNFRMMSRWMLLFAGFRSIVSRVREMFGMSHAHRHHTHPDLTNIDKKTAFFIGTVHGIGAETPTQLLLFVTVAGVGGKVFGSFLVFIFVLGLMLSNTIISLLTLLGYTGVKKNGLVYVTFGMLSGIFSIVIGFIFLTGHTYVLPAILGG